MARFINQQHVPMKIRRPHLDRYRRMLRESLHNPGLGAEQKDFIKFQLACCGKPKVYGHAGKHHFVASTTTTASAQPPKAAEASAPAVSAPEPAIASLEPLPDEAALNRMTKAQIEAQAQTESVEGVSTNQLKAEMVASLLAGRS